MKASVHDDGLVRWIHTMLMTQVPVLQDHASLVLPRSVRGSEPWPAPCSVIWAL